MGIRAWWKREVFVAVHAQTWRFRVVKYIVLAMIFSGVYAWGGWTLVWRVLLTLLTLALCIHFFFRWKTHAWTRSWGPYKALKLPE